MPRVRHLAAMPQAAVSQAAVSQAAVSQVAVSQAAVSQVAVSQVAVSQVAVWLLSVLLAFCAMTGTVRSAPLTFEVDVMAALSKAGCNRGGCHGNQRGKGGFRLSLRGQDPQADFASITRGAEGRRVDSIDPNSSLFLLKPSGRVAHGGGRPAPAGSPVFAVLRGWLEGGGQAPDLGPNATELVSLTVAPDEPIVLAPESELQLRVTAKFSDGQTRDVTSWAVYEASNLAVEITTAGLVTRREFGESTVVVRYLDQQVATPIAFLPAREPVGVPQVLNNFVDAHLETKHRRLRIRPSQLCSDEAFVRRAHLDLIGVSPTAEEARAFVADLGADKRRRLVDRLLARPEFNEFWALRWSDILRNEEKSLDVKGVTVFHAWIRDWLASGRPMNDFAAEMIRGRGSTYEKPAANFYRANRSPTVRAEAVARVFLGVRLQCAKCHNHPFDRWTQDDYYQWAAMFARVDYKIVDNKRKDKFDKNEFNGDQVVIIKDKGELKNARTGKDAPPRFLGETDSDIRPRQDRLKLLANWLTSPDNRQFVRTQVNWVWFHLLGRGLVEPIDDFRVTNPAVNPPLLEALCDEYLRQNFDLRSLIRTIAVSRAYQRSAEPNETNRGDQRNFSRAIVRRLTAEQLIDAQSSALDQPAAFVGYPLGTRAVQIPGVRRFRRREKPPVAGDRFLTTFGKPERLLACECERSNETTLSQALELCGGPSLNNRIQAPGNRLQRLANSELSDEQIVAELYWSTLCRPPNAAEKTAALKTLAVDPQRLVGIQDVAWALINAKEFLFR